VRVRASGKSAEDHRGTGEGLARGSRSVGRLLHDIFNPSAPLEEKSTLDTDSLSDDNRWRGKLTTHRSVPLWQALHI